MPAAARPAPPKPATARDYARRIDRVVRHVADNLDAPLELERLREFAPVRLAAIRHRGPYMKIGSAFERLGAWAASRGMVGPGTRFIGIYWDDPEAVPAARLRADAGMTVPADFAGDGEVGVVDLAGGRIAVARHQGPYAELEAAYRWLYREWLPASGEEPDDRPCFEEYVNDCRTLPPAEWLTEICLPLAARR